MEAEEGSDSRHYREGPPSSPLLIACQSFSRDIPHVPLFVEEGRWCDTALARLNHRKY